MCVDEPVDAHRRRAAARRGRSLSRTRLTAKNALSPYRRRGAPGNTSGVRRDLGTRAGHTDDTGSAARHGGAGIPVRDAGTPHPLPRLGSPATVTRFEPRPGGWPPDGVPERDLRYRRPAPAGRADEPTGENAVLPHRGYRGPAEGDPDAGVHPLERESDLPSLWEPAGTGTRTGLLTLAFWVGLALAVVPWWFTTPGHSITDSAGVLTALGRITGLIGGYILLMQVLMMSRAAWLEHTIGANRLMTWHRELGGFLVVAVLGHAVLITLGYAAADRRGLIGETWHMLTTLQDMISAFIATGVLVGIGAFAIRAVRRRLSYETWYYLHLTSYLVLLLGYGHQFADGEELFAHGLARSYWMGLYAVVLGFLVWGRVVGPLRLNLRHRLRVARVVPEGRDMVSIYIAGRGLDRLEARAGQFFRWRFLTAGCWWQAHPFSLSAAPNGQWLRLTIKAVGDHTEDLQYLEPGVRVVVEGPSGVFTADRRVRFKALLIAAGSGIAPIRALLEELPEGTPVIYRASTVEDLVFRRELDWLAQRRHARVWYVVGGRDDPWPRHVFSPRGLRELVPDVSRRDVYLCGPEGLISASLRSLRKLRVPRRQIHLDPFEF
jgi:predicted ferric reductase